MKMPGIKRWTVLAYGVAAYLAFVATLGYSVLFLGNLFVMRTIDAAAGVPLGDALPVNIGLLLLFALQHSGMARPGFKDWLARVSSPGIVRSTYVLMSCAAMILLMVLWQPMGGVVWRVDDPLAHPAPLLRAHPAPALAQVLALFLGQSLEALASFATALASSLEALLGALAGLGVHSLEVPADPLATLFPRHPAQPLAHLAPPLGRHRFEIAYDSRARPGTPVALRFAFHHRDEPEPQEDEDEEPRSTHG